MAEVFVPISFFLGVFGVVYVFVTTRNRERMAMIEKGVDPEIFAERRSRFSIKLGLLAIGVALGVLTGQLIAHLSSMEIEPATFSMIFLFGGGGLVLEHFLARKEKGNGSK